MADALLQTLTIKLNAEVGNTKRKLKDVATSVEKLEEIGKKADWSVFEQIRTNLEGIAKIDFSNVADSLKDVVTALKAVGISAKQVKDMPIMSSPRMENSTVSETTEPSWQLQGVKMVADVFSAGTKYLKEFNAKIAEAQKGVHDVQDAFDPWRRSLAGCYLELSQIEFLVNQIKSKGAPVADFDALKQQLLEAGFSLNKVNELLSQIGKANGFGNWEESLRQCGLTANEVSTVIKDLFESQREPINFEKLREVLISLGFSADEAEATMAKLSNATKKAGKDAEDGSKGFSKMLNSIKRITFYRMVRRAIQLIGQAITQGIQNLALFDSSFNNSMSEMLTSLTYFKNSIGVALAPIIEVATPAVVMLLDGLASAFNAVGKALSYAFGSKEIVQAKKDTQDYAKTLKKLKNITLGIDELNIINDKNKNDYFIKIEIDGEEKIDSVADKIGNLGLLVGGLALLFSVNLKGALLKVGALLGSVKISLAGLITTFAGGIVTVSQFYDIMKNGLNWSNFAKLISGATIAVLGLQLAFHKLDVTLIGSTIVGILAIVAGIKDMYENGITLQNAILTALGAITVALSLAWLAMKTATGQALMLQLALHGLHTSFLSVTLAVGTLVAGVLAFVALFKKVQEGWGQMNFWQKLASVLGLVIVAVSTLVATISAFLQQWHVFGIAVASGLVGSALAMGAIASTPQFAQGGFPEDGFFYANHNELVGQFSNGQTAVANNAQIVEGIKQGVIDAIAESGGLGSNNQGGREIVVQIDGREIGRASEKYEAQKGEKIFSGGYHYGH